MKKDFLCVIILGTLHVVAILWSLDSVALIGLDGLQKKLLEKNQEVLSFEKIIEAKEALKNSSRSNFYPTLNAVGGWQQNTTDEFSNPQKGTVGYVEGKLNLFRGFKDLSIGDQKDVDLQLAQLDLAIKKKSLRLSLTEAASEMVLLHKLQEILTEELSTTQNQKKMAAKKVSAGLTGAVDNLEFDLRENEIQIEKSQLEQRHQEAHQKFVHLFGEEIQDTDLNNISFQSPESLQTVHGNANIQNTFAYQRTELLRQRAESEKKEVRSEFYPTFDFVYSVGRLTPSEEKPLKFNESRYGVLLTIPLFSGLETYHRSRASDFADRSLTALKNQESADITAELNILKTRQKEFFELLSLNENKLVNSQKYFDFTLAEYRRGIKNSPDLVSATERLFSAKKKKYELLKDLEVLQTQFEKFQ